MAGGSLEFEAKWTIGNSTWSPPTSETFEYPDEVWDEELGEYRTVGTITDTIDTPGAHYFEGNALEIAIRGYADTEGEYDANISATRQFWGMSEEDFSLTGRAIAGINNDDGGYAGVGVIATQPLTDNVSLYGKAQAYATGNGDVEGYVESGVMGEIPIGGVGSIPAQIGMQQGFDGDSPKVVGRVSVFQW